MSLRFFPFLPPPPPPPSSFPFRRDESHGRETIGAAQSKDLIYPRLDMADECFS